MNRTNHIFDFVGQIFVVFGFTTTFLMVFCSLFGEEAKNISTIFALGSEGLRVETLVQYFLLAIIIVSLKWIFFTDAIIRNMPMAVRVILMFTAVIVSIVIFIITFRWFPVDNYIAWGMFVCSFTICAAVSTIVSIIREKIENKTLEEALQRLKKGELDGEDN